MVTTERETRKMRQFVPGDDQIKFPRDLNWNEIQSKMKTFEDEYEGANTEEINPQGSMLSSLLGNIQVDLNHRVPAMENLGNFDFLGSVSNGFTGILDAISEFIRQYVLYITVLLLIAHYASNQRRGTIFYLFTASFGLVVLFANINALFLIDETTPSYYPTPEEFNILYNNLSRSASPDEKEVKVKFPGRYDNDETISEDEGGEDINPQGFITELTLAESLLVLLSTVFGLAPRNGGVMVLKEYLKITPNMRGNVLSTISTAMTTAGKLCKDLGCEAFLNSIFDIPVVEENVGELIERINSFINDLLNNTDSSYAHNTSVYQSLVQESRELEKTLSKGSFSHVQLQDSLKNLEKSKNNMNRKFSALSGTRPEPVVVFFTGEPATMKTSLASEFAYLLNNFTLPDECKRDFEANPDTYTYRKSVEKWWDGYTSKANIAIIDDMFQVVDNANEPGSSEGAMLIRMTNSEEFAVPIAEATGKGSTYFRSNFILATSNISGTELVNSVHSKDAVRRRLHFHVKVTINPKYLNADGKIDYDRLPLAADIYNEGGETDNRFRYRKFPTDLWHLSCNEVKGSDIPRDHTPVTFQDLFTRVVERYYKHQAWYEISKSTQREVMENFQNELGNTLKVPKDELMDLKRYLNRPPRMPGALEIRPQSFWEHDHDSEYGSTYSGSFSRLRDEMKTRWRELPDERKDDIIYLFHELLYHRDKYLIWDSMPYGTFMESLDEKEMERICNCLADYINSGWNIQSPFNAFVTIMGKRHMEGLHFLTGEKVAEDSAVEKVRKIGIVKIKQSINFCRKNMMIIVLALSISTASAYAIHKIVSYLNGDTESQSGITERYISKGPSRSKKNSSKPTKAPREVVTNVSQGSDLEYCLKGGTSFGNGVRGVNNNVLTSVIDKYHFIIYVQVDKGDTTQNIRLGHCVNIKSNKFIMPYHFILVLEDFADKHKDSKINVFFITASGNRKMKFSLTQVLKSTVEIEEFIEKDVVLLTLGNEVTSVGAMKYFIENLSSINRNQKHFPITIVGSKHVDDERHGIVYRVIETFASLQKEEISVKNNWITDDDITHYSLENVLKYNGTFSGGDCGSIVSLSSSGIGSRIIVGIHLAGTNRNGYCTIITKGDIEKMLQHLGRDVSFEEELVPQGLTLTRKIETNLVDTEMKSRGKFDSKHSTSLCGKSDIVRSLIFNKIDFPECKNKVAPSLLMQRRDKSGNVIDPRTIALNNYARDIPSIDNDVLSAACSSYFNLLYRSDNTTIEAKKDVVSVEVALHSFGDSINGIASATSAGWPMNTGGEDDIKKMYFKAVFTNDDDKKSEALTIINDNIKSVEDLYDRRIRPVFVYSDALKDETRPIEKALAGKTRMFSGCPFYLLIMFRRYFGRFMDFFFGANLDVGSAIGINPYSLDWHELGLNLTKFSKGYLDLGVGAGDYSKFDCSECPDVLWGVYAVIESWYDTNDRSSLIRTYLWQEIVNSRHIFQEDYYEWYCGMPSGNPMTAIINTIYNHLAFRMSWHYCGLDIYDFNNNVYMCALGDDNVFTVHPDFRDKFNELTMVSAMAEIGLTYTTEIKGEAKVPFRRLTEVEFLKRSFRPIRLRGELRYLSPIQKDSIFSMLHWTKRGRNSEQITVDNISLAIRELSLHGEEEYCKYVPELKRVREQYFPCYISVHKEFMNYKDTLYSVLEMEHYL